MIAKDLDQIYMNFDPARPLPGVSEFYVKRKRNPLASMKRTLLHDSFVAPKLLFSGHTGSGKSTELNRLMAYPEIQEKYFTVHYSIRDVLDPAGLEYTDLLLSIGAQIYIKATDEANLKLEAGILDELRKWIGTIETEESHQDNMGTELGADLKILQARLKTGHTSRISIRRKIEVRLPEFISATNLIIADVEQKLNKKVLVVVDDLDKPDLKVAHELFYERKTSLTLPNCGIIYTIPIALHYALEAGQVIRSFTKSYVLPNITINRHADRSPDADGHAVMREFIEKRMSLDLIDENALEHAISISGGVFREMARIMEMAADSADERGAEKIERQDIEDAESEIGNEFRRMLEPEHYKVLRDIYETKRLEVSDRILKEIHETRDLNVSEIIAKLYHSLSILEYRNKKAWYDIHPVIIPLLEERRT